MTRSSQRRARRSCESAREPSRGPARAPRARARRCSRACGWTASTAIGFEYDVSRFDDFAAHVGSFSSQVRRLPAIGAQSTIAELEARNAPFTEWVAELGIPLQTGIERLEIGLHASGLLVIESPEPFGGDLRLALRQGGQDLATTVVADERGAAFLLVPVSPLAGRPRTRVRHLAHALPRRLARPRKPTRPVPHAGVHAFSRATIRTATSSAQGNRAISQAAQRHLRDIGNAADRRH